MAANDLEVGEPRLGWFIDGHPDTAEVAVMLRDTGTAIELKIPLKGISAKDDPYERWWSFGVHFGDDPERTKHSYGPPRVLLLHDTKGPVVLLGCRATGSAPNLNAGEGTIVANFAVLGGSSLNYEKINGLRTEVPALAEWTELNNDELVVEQCDQSVQMTLSNAEPVSLARPMNLSMRSTWRIQESLGGLFVYQGVKVETSVREVRS